MELGCDEVGLSDTTGYANPAQLRRLIKLIRAEIGNDKLKSSNIQLTCDPKELFRADIIIIAVPTPIDEARTPDFAPLISASTLV